MDRSADVVIIGAGIAGAASAYYLAKRGAKVIVCEKGEVGGEQSSRNWGFVRLQGRDPAEIPLMVESSGIWQGLERELNDDIEWLQGGNLITFSNAEEQAAWEAWIQIAAGHGVESRLLTRREIDEVIPGNGFDCLGAVYSASDGQAEPAKVVPALRRAAEGRGAEFLTHCAVFDIERTAGAISGVLTERGGIDAPIVVCAAGAWSQRMLRLLGLKLPQMWLRGSVARTTPAPIATETATWTGVAFRQRRDGRVNIATRSADHDLTLDSIFNFPAFSGAYSRNRSDVKIHISKLFAELFMGRFSRAALRRELVNHRILDPEPNHASLERTLAELKRLMPAFAGVEIERSWAGYIDFSPDMLPTIERLDDPAGLVLATGFSGHGFGMGPIAGRLVSELILDGKPSLDLSAFRLSRFSDGSKLEPFAVV